MARLNVYLPDELAAQARAAGLNVSALTQEAVRHSLRVRSTADWLAGLPPVPGRSISHDDGLEALDAARDEAPTRHG